MIRAQPSQYVVATVAGRKYLLTPRDVLTVPRLKDVNVGDVVALSDIHELGSREYTLRGNPVISADKVRVDATVIEHTRGAQEVVVKRKRRKGQSFSTPVQISPSTLRLSSPCPSTHILIISYS